jgi:hypothetical protein
MILRKAYHREKTMLWDRLRNCSTDRHSHGRRSKDQSFTIQQNRMPTFPLSMIWVRSVETFRFSILILPLRVLIKTDPYSQQAFVCGVNLSHSVARGEEKLWSELILWIFIGDSYPKRQLRRLIASRILEICWLDWWSSLQETLQARLGYLEELESHLWMKGYAMTCLRTWDSGNCADTDPSLVNRQVFILQRALNAPDQLGRWA